MVRQRVQDIKGCYHACSLCVFNFFSASTGMRSNPGTQRYNTQDNALPYRVDFLQTKGADTTKMSALDRSHVNVDWLLEVILAD